MSTIFYLFKSLLFSGSQSGRYRPPGGVEGSQGGVGGHLGVLGTLGALKCRKPGFSILIRYKVMIIMSCCMFNCCYLI